jgi:hypothetical protein
LAISQGEHRYVAIPGLRQLAKSVASEYGDKGAIVISYGGDGVRIGVEGLSRPEAEKALCIAIYYGILFSENGMTSWEIA